MNPGPPSAPVRAGARAGTPPTARAGTRPTARARAHPNAPATRDLLALDQQVCFALAVASRNVIALYRPLLEPMGLTHPQYLVMLALWEQAPLKVGELARRLSLEPATLSPLLKRLEANGMIVRERDPHDDRALAVALTPRGAKARDQATAVPPAIVERLGMDLGELEALRDGLTRIIAAARTEPANRTDQRRPDATTGR